PTRPKMSTESEECFLVRSPDDARTGGHHGASRGPIGLPVSSARVADRGTAYTLRDDDDPFPGSTQTNAPAFWCGYRESCRPHECLRPTDQEAGGEKLLDLQAFEPRMVLPLGGTARHHRSSSGPWPGWGTPPSSTSQWRRDGCG